MSTSRKDVISRLRNSIKKLVQILNTPTGICGMYSGLTLNFFKARE